MKNGIIRVHINNFKKIENLDVQLNGASVYLIGDNEVGKSSFMQAVFGLLSNKQLPDRAITDGKTDGKIEIKFAVDGREYTAVRRFTEAKPDGYFEIITDDKLKTNKLSFLESLVGNIAFNPFDFVEMCQTPDGRRKQVEFLRHLVAPEINARMDDISREYKLTFDARSAVNATIKQLDGEIAGMSVPDPETYSTPVDVTDLMDQLKRANETNARRLQLANDANRGTAAITEQEGRITRLKNELKAAELERDRMIKKLADINGELSSIKPVQTAEIESKIKNASEHNRNVETVKKYQLARQRFDMAKLDSESMSEKLDRLQEEKRELIVKSKLPVDGLSFDESGLFLHGLPLDEKQVSTSAIMELGVRLAVAINPKLKILRIPRGESLGKKRMDEIVAFANANGYQLFIERVESGVDKLTVQFIES